MNCGCIVLASSVAPQSCLGARQTTSVRGWSLVHLIFMLCLSVGPTLDHPAFFNRSVTTTSRVVYGKAPGPTAVSLTWKPLGGLSLLQSTKKAQPRIVTEPEVPGLADSNQ